MTWRLLSIDHVYFVFSWLLQLLHKYDPTVGANSLRKRIRLQNVFRNSLMHYRFTLDTTKKSIYR
jgi:hypothetical protein